MHEIFKLALSLSLSGSVLAVLVFACCRLLGNRLSKRFQYYIWLVVVLRLLIPFSPESAIMPRLWEIMPSTQTEPDITPSAFAVQKPAPSSQAQTEPVEAGSHPAETGQQSAESRPATVTPQTPQRESSLIPVLQAVLQYIWSYFWILWLAVAAGMMIRKITLYQSFVKYLRAGRAEVDDIETLDRFAELSERMGVRRAIDLYTNRLTASPLILGFRRPAVVLPEIPGNQEEFRLICLHELTHYKRRDIWYKWLLQIVLCLHWFNPLVHFMVREVNRICELSCDEDVLRILKAEEHRQYGDTLLHSLQTPGTYREGLAALTLNESARSLKESPESIMKFTKPNRATAALAVFLAALLFTGAYALGAYTVVPLAMRQEENSGISPEGLPIMSAANREIFETHLDRYYVTGLFRVDFSPEDPSALVANGGDIMMSVYNVLLDNPLTDMPEAVPAPQVEALLMAKLAVNDAAVKNAFADYYDASANTYELYGGLGGGPSLPIVTGSRRQGDMLTVSYTWYDGDPAADEFRYVAGASGTLIIRLTKNDFQFVSNKVAAREEVAGNESREASATQTAELNNLKPEILPVLQELISDYDNQIDNINFTAVPDYCVLPEVESTSDFTLAGTETGLSATIPVSGASEWQMEVLVSNFDGVYRAEGASFSIIPDSFMGKAMARGLAYTQVKTLINSGLSEDEILSMPLDEIQKFFSQFVSPDNNNDEDAIPIPNADAPLGSAENPKVEDMTDPDVRGTTVINLNSNGQNSLIYSSSFEVGTNQVLTLEIKSSINGTVDFYLFSPALKDGMNQTRHYTFGGENDTKTFRLSEGRWAYNCTGFFDSGEISIVGTVRQIMEEENT